MHQYNDNSAVEGLLHEYETVHNITGLPLIHGEFSFTAIDSGVPNLKGARSCPNPPHCQPGRPFVLQRERAEQARLQTEAIAQVPYLVGYQYAAAPCPLSALSKKLLHAVQLVEVG